MREKNGPQGFKHTRKRSGQISEKNMRGEKTVVHKLME
jgi:hypothetical protein